ncbi:TIR domain-containing protein [Paractinoplanes ovalisporus]|nr:TIR domain-containing protein [Actinoplanes ovalisporus]
MVGVTNPADATLAPRVFVSYSWDSPQHSAWVLKLATRLRHNGVDVILDRWNARLGTNLPLFMEEGIRDADRILVIVTDTYTRKAYEGRGGVAYERRMLTAELMDRLDEDRILPVLRDNPDRRIPMFLGNPVYLDFRRDENYEAEYIKLLHNLHGQEILPVPPIGPNPLQVVSPDRIARTLRHDPARYVSPDVHGTETFDFSNNDGEYELGSGAMTFTLRVGEAGRGVVHVYNNPADIETIASASGVTDVTEVSDASAYDGSSRVRTVREGDAVVLCNSNGYWAVVCIDQVHTRGSSPDGHPSLTFRFAIQPDHTANFSQLRQAN